MTIYLAFLSTVLIPYISRDAGPAEPQDAVSNAALPEAYAHPPRERREPRPLPIEDPMDLEDATVLTPTWTPLLTVSTTSRSVSYTLPVTLFALPGPISELL